MKKKHRLKTIFTTAQLTCLWFDVLWFLRLCLRKPPRRWVFGGHRAPWGSEFGAGTSLRPTCSALSPAPPHPADAGGLQHLPSASSPLKRGPSYLRELPQVPATAQQAPGLCERNLPESRPQSEQQRSFLSTEGTPCLGVMPFTLWLRWPWPNCGRRQVSAKPWASRGSLSGGLDVQGTPGSPVTPTSSSEETELPF